jgi:hypothetical protein
MLQSALEKGSIGLTTYEKLDRIADLVTPALALAALILPWQPIYSRSVAAWRRIACAILSVAVAYAGMYLDKFTGAWPAMSLDYSTHSAVCVALLAPLATLSRRWTVAAVLIGFAYAALMIYQRYHTSADILSTAVPIGLASWGIWRLLSPQRTA